MFQVDNLRFNAPTSMKKGRAVTITHATQTAVYTAAAAAGEYITVSDESNGSIAVRKLSVLTDAVYADAGGTVTMGSDLEVVGAEGKFQNKSAGVAVAKARTTGASGSFISLYV